MPLPNIVLVILDTLRCDHVSCYGYERETTPFVDSLAREGILFEYCTATAPWTLPSHASMFTGTYPSRHRIGFTNMALPPNLTTMAEFLQREGYQTVGLSSNTWLRSESGLDRGFEAFHLVNESSKHQETKIQKALFYVKKKLRQYFSDRGAARTKDILQSWLARRRDPDRPLFLFINYLEPHLPYNPPRAYRRKFARFDTHEVNQDAWAYFVGEKRMTDKDFEVLKDLYDAAINYNDDQFRQLWHVLQDAGALEDTVAIITSDHGENLGDHRLMDHQYSLHETLLHVPLILWSNSRHLEFGARKIATPVQLCDILPTLTQLTNPHASLLEAQCQGYSFLPYLVRGDSATKIRTWSAAEYLEPNLRIFKRRFPSFDYTAFDVRLRAFTRRNYKYIISDSGREWLYDLATDPSELHDLHTRKPEICTEMRQGLEEELGSAWMPNNEELSELEFDDPDVVERLRSLGYL